MKTLLLLSSFVAFSAAFAQEFSYKGEGQGGLISVGMRSTLSSFNGGHHEHETDDAHNDGGAYSLGLGGQFRVQASNRVNTEWFFDYLPSSNSLVRRDDYHIGWSVMYYVLENPHTLLRPYVLGGHCFDYTSRQEIMNTSNRVERWSSAVQMGLGTHLRLNKRLDLSLTTQYMMHLGTHVETTYTHDGVVFEKTPGGSLEGHLLTTLSLNFKLVDLW